MLWKVLLYHDLRQVLRQQIIPDIALIDIKHGALIDASFSEYLSKAWDTKRKVMYYRQIPASILYGLQNIGIFTNLNKCTVFHSNADVVFGLLSAYCVLCFGSSVY